MGTTVLLQGRAAPGAERRWRLRGILAAVVTILALAGLCASARADVQVTSAGGGYAQSPDLSTLKPDVTDGVYSDVSAGGGPTETETVTDGYSLRNLLRSLTPRPPSYGAVEVPGPGGRSVVLNTAQATDPGAYADGFPVVWQDPSGTHFLVPSSPGNPGELITAGTITIELHSGAALGVGIAAVPSKATVGKPVRFYAGKVGGAPGPFTYSWQFGDEGVSSLASPTHVYASIGVDQVYLRVTGPDDSLGVTQASVTVGTVPTAPSTQTGVVGGSGTGIGGSGSGQGTGGTAGGQGGGSNAPLASAPNPGQATTHSRTPRVSRPTGPLVSGIPITYVGKPLTPGALAAAGAAAARAANLRANAAGLDVGMWIWFVVLVMLFGGAVLEWVGPRRPWLLTPRPQPEAPWGDA